MTPYTPPDGSLTESEFRRRMRDLVLTAREEGIDVVGSHVVPETDREPGLQVEITVVRRKG